MRNNYFACRVRSHPFVCIMPTSLRPLVFGELFQEEKCKENTAERFTITVDRGLFVCSIKKIAMDADLVGAFNILHNGESLKDSRNGRKTAPPSLLPALAGNLRPLG